jgi:hypothetical protein
MASVGDSGAENASVGGNVTTDALIDAQELCHWMGLPLRFAVVGLHTCGTTSMRMNLGQHPDVHFPTPADVLWAPENSRLTEAAEGRRILPLMSAIKAINTSSGSQLSGFYGADIFKDPYERQALAAVPNLQVVAVVCDPVRRLESLFGQWFCRQGRCARDIANVGRIPQFLTQISVAPPLRELRRLFGNRLLLVHQDALRSRETYNGLLERLGGAPFPASIEFQRYHTTNNGRQTGLCSNATNVQVVQKLLATERKAVEEALEAAAAVPNMPEPSWKSRSHCDTHKQPVFSHCSDRTSACAEVATA